MRGRHHASSETTVTYRPKTEAQPAGPGGGPVDLAYSANCHFCNVTHISVMRPFPIPYRCSTCAAEQEALKKATALAKKAEPVPELVLSPAQAALAAKIVKVTERMEQLGGQVAAERVRRDELLLRAQALGLSTRAVGSFASMSSPGVVSAIARAKERADGS